MREQREEIDRLDLAVAVVTFEADWLAKAYRREADIPWPVLIDRQRTLYRAYGMERGSYWAVLGPRSWGAYLKLMVRGRKPRLPKDDPYQLGGDVLVDPAGIVRLHHNSTTPADRPDVAAILGVVRRTP